MNKVYLSLGTNMGNRLGYLNRACGMIEDSVYVFSVKKSKIYETKAWGYTEQPDFLNICLEVDTSFDPHEMLKFCQNIETRLNRKRIIKWGHSKILSVRFFYDLFGMRTLLTAVGDYKK